MLQRLAPMPSSRQRTLAISLAAAGLGLQCMLTAGPVDLSASSGDWQAGPLPGTAPLPALVTVAGLLVSLLFTRTRAPSQLDFPAGRLFDGWFSTVLMSPVFLVLLMTATALLCLPVRAPHLWAGTESSFSISIPRLVLHGLFFCYGLAAPQSRRLIELLSVHAVRILAVGCLLVIAYLATLAVCTFRQAESEHAMLLACLLAQAIWATNWGLLGVVAQFRAVASRNSGSWV